MKWLAARHTGTTAFTLRWCHDSMRARDAGEGALKVGTADPTRDVEHLCRLLAEHLAKIELLAPVGELVLTADEVHDLVGSNKSLLAQHTTQCTPGTSRAGERSATMGASPSAVSLTRPRSS